MLISGTNRRIILALVAALLLAGGAWGQPRAPYKVKTINPCKTTDTLFQYWECAPMNGALFFTLDDLSKKSLWKTDGTASGTVMIKEDLYQSSATLNHLPMSYLAAFNGALYFQARTSPSGPAQLWKSDGTTAGTVELPGPANPNQMTAAESCLVFMAEDATGEEPWRSDGTPSGTRAIMDIFPGGQGSNPQGLTALNGEVFFSAGSSLNDRSLWKTDGTTSGTVQVNNNGSRMLKVSVSKTKALKDKIYFQGRDYYNGVELWSSDGTQNGTLMHEIYWHDSSSYPYDLVEMNGTIFFTAQFYNGFELWKLDGMLAVMIKDIWPGTESGSWIGYGSAPDQKTPVNGMLYFTAEDGVHGRELWKSDGTEAGTVMVKDLNPGTSGTAIVYMTGVGDTLFFVVDDELNGPELWKSEGTETGTVKVGVIGGEGAAGVVFGLTKFGDRLLTVVGGPQYGRELWALDLQAPRSGIRSWLHYSD